MQQANYGPFPYSPINRRAKWRWPNGARLALWVVPNIEYFSLKTPLAGQSWEKASELASPTVRPWGQRDYGNRVGIFRLMEVLERHGIRGTAATNADICDHHPEIIEDAVKLGWEFMGHNKTNTTRLYSIPAEQEHELIRYCTDRLQKATGKRPAGWLGSALAETWNTLDFLAVEGYRYVCDWVNDDQPYIMSLEGGKKLVAMPYSQEINDKPAFERQMRTADEFRDMICRQFDVLYREGAESGRVMGIALHPYITGVPHRIGALDAALAHICKHERVWKATGLEIARHYVAQAKT